jgi:metal-dependent HD superfamily phosphatase/phosphodiesterase
MAEPATGQQPVSLKDVKSNPEVKHLITGANDVMMAMGYTEHGHRHSGVVSSITRYILEHSGDEERVQELGAIAGYLHDIGNVVNRVDHPMIGASMCYTILHEMGMDTREDAPNLGAIGNHEEGDGLPIRRISAALIIADKSDVQYRREQNPVPQSF